MGAVPKRNEQQGQGLGKREGQAEEDNRENMQGGD